MAGKCLLLTLESWSELWDWLVSGQWYCDVIEVLDSVAKVWMLAAQRDWMRYHWLDRSSVQLMGVKHEANLGCVK